MGAEGVRVLLGLPGVQADSAAIAALHLLDEAMAAGDTCLDLAEWAGRDWGGQPLPALDTWRASLLACGLVAEAIADLPLVLDDHLLSARRFAAYEEALAQTLRARMADTQRLAGLAADPAVAGDIRALFPLVAAALVDGVDWQRLATLVALGHGLSLITGGPGSGKTTVAGRMIAILDRIHQRQGRELAVQIAAPTGKAAQRLRESLLETGAELVERGFLEREHLRRLGARVATLHRLLHDRHLATVDLLVIDEVSMADVATLARVLQRVPATAQVVLLGDPRQLASVEAGHVLGELAAHDRAAVSAPLAAWYASCSDGQAPSVADDDDPLAQAQVCLRKNWRSAASPAVSGLAQAMLVDAPAVAACLADPTLAPGAARQGQRDGRSVPIFIERRDLSSARQLLDELLPLIVDWAASVVAAEDVAQALAVHGRQRVLCARRVGPVGATALNQAIEDELERRGLIVPDDHGHYPGRPLLVTRNNYDLQLFNGDIGIVVGQGIEARACFPDDGGGLRTVPLHRLDACEPVFAMTIHKSQGSQFEQVDIVCLDDDSGEVGKLLSRELIYTAVTRAAYAARLWADHDLLLRAIERHTVRRSGLGRFLAG